MELIWSIPPLTSIYIPWPLPLVWGVADNTKETTKTMGMSLRSSTNDEGPSRVWMALLEQHILSSPRLPQLTSLHRCHLPYCPTTGFINSRCQSELCHNYLPLIPIPSMLTCLPYIHPPIIQGSLYSIHPPKPRPPSSTSPVNFCIHYLFQQLFIIHPLNILSLIYCLVGKITDE